MSKHTFPCGCIVVFELFLFPYGQDTLFEMIYCPKHSAVDALYEATRKAEQLASIATDWNLTEAEIDGEMVSVYELKQWFQSALALADGEVDDD